MMGDISTGIDSYFWLTAGGLFFGSIALCVRYAYRSKCKEVDLCCIRIVRDTETEKEEDMQEMKTPSTPNGRPSSLSA